MPFIVTTKRPPEHFDAGISAAFLPKDYLDRERGIVSRRAVATLEEAHIEAMSFAMNGRSIDRLRAATIPKSGGSVGPLPDGTVIEVEAIRSDGRDPRREACPLIFTSDWLHMSEQERCDAFNAREAAPS